MENSLFLGSVLWPLIIVIWIGLLMNSDDYKKLIENFLKESLVVYISGIIFFIFGLLMVYSHNIWEWSWVVIITFLSWIILIKSAFLIINPKIFEAILKKIKLSSMHIQIAGILYLILWTIISFFSFM